MDIDIETTESMGMAAIYATAAIEQGDGEKCCVTLREVRRHKVTNDPLYEFRVELPGLRAMVKAVGLRQLKVVPQVYAAMFKGLKRATERAYTARELLTLGGGA